MLENTSDDGVKVNFLKKSSLYIVGGVLTALGILVFAYSAYVGSVSDSLVVEEDVINEDQVTVDDIRGLTPRDGMAPQGLDSTQEDLNLLVSDIDKQLSSPNIAPDAQKRLLLSKALALGSIRSLGITGDHITQATNIFNTVYSSATLNTDEDKYKFATVPLYFDMLHATCYPPQLAQALPVEYSNYYRLLVNEEGLTDKQAVLLAFDRFADGSYDPRYINDTSLNANRAFTLALYFHAFGSGKSPVAQDTEEREVLLWSKLQTLLATETQSGLLLTGPNRSVIEPSRRIAFAFDIANTYAKEKVTTALNKEIDEKYEQTFELIEDLRVENDPTSTAVNNVMTAVFYLESLHRRYTESELSSDKVNQIIDLFIANVSLNVDTRELYSGFFLEGMTEEGAWMPVRAKFIELAAKYPVLRSYFSDTFGIDL